MATGGWDCYIPRVGGKGYVHGRGEGFTGEGGKHLTRRTNTEREDEACAERTVEILLPGSEREKFGGDRAGEWYDLNGNSGSST